MEENDELRMTGTYADCPTSTSKGRDNSFSPSRIVRREITFHAKTDLFSARQPYITEERKLKGSHSGERVEERRTR